ARPRVRERRRPRPGGDPEAGRPARRAVLRGVREGQGGGRRERQRPVTATQAPVDAALLRSQLWSEGSPLAVYAVLHGARDPAIPKAVLAAELPQAGLYAGQIPKELVETAPYLVKLAPDAPFTARLFAQGWGQSWGIFALSTATLEEMRRHLRKF